MYIPVFFELPELVCPHIYNKWSYNPEMIWNFFDPRLLETLDFIRKEIDKPIFVNNWKNGGQFSQRGLRCNICDLTSSKTKNNQIYMSSHSLGKAVDFDVKGMKSLDVRRWLYSNADKLPYPICVEDDVNWVHLDMRFINNQKIYFFKV